MFHGFLPLGGVEFFTKKNVGHKNHRGFPRNETHVISEYPQDPWDWYIYLYFVDVGKCTIHGAYRI